MTQCSRNRNHQTMTGLAVAVVLDCQGNTRNLIEYISKRVNWKHVANDGTIHKITTGFYLDEGADETKYDIQHGNSDSSDTNYSFKLTILRVNDDDDGRYVCENEDGRLVILSSKEVNFTVINPVEKVKIELLSMWTGHRMYSESKIMENSVIYEIEEGDFEVTCIAEGSNPSPQMTLKFNNNVQQVDTQMVKSFVGNRPSYKGTFKKTFSLSANTIEIQTIECSAGIPRKQFPDKYAGLKVKVFSAAFDYVECDNVSALVRYRQTKVTCKLHSIRALDCGRISWKDGNNNFVIYPGNKTDDPSYGPVVVDCDFRYKSRNLSDDKILGTQIL
ncbi:hypothetical protein ACJMK2_023869 [Sinanodonta woodiana]|uniref:Ig-like domain-containing protein n=1 Tax=Sinanodonta woodiana TaxID=1069815 RepID=A0ABD3T6D1_SINWO